MMDILVIINDRAKEDEEIKRAVPH